MKPSKAERSESEVRAKIERDSNNISNFFKTGELKDSCFSDEELGINRNDYLNEDGNYNSVYEYHKDRDYKILKEFLKIMEPTKEDFYTLKHYYNTYSFLKKEYDYSFVKSPSLRHLLLGEPLPETGEGDKFYCLLDIEIRKIMQKLIPKMFDEKNKDFNQEVCARIKRIIDTDYILTEKENDKTFINLIMAEKES